MKRYEHKCGTIGTHVQGVCMSNRVRKAIITDAGFASRYLPIAKTIPKGMLPLGNKPIMQLMVEECVEAGIEEIIIVATSG